MHHPAGCLQPRRLGALARARRAQQYYIHHAALSPERTAGLAPSWRGLELRLLDEVAILVRDQMALDLADRVHGHIDDDQQAGAAQAEIEPRLR